MADTPTNEDLFAALDDREGVEADADFDIISFKTVEEIERSIVDSPFRAIYQNNNFLLPQIKDVVEESRTVNLRPEYQRRSRWTSKQKSLLIESFLLNIPVPPIFLFEVDFARYEVMDGQQRLLTIREFFSNRFKLSSLSVLAPLNGRTYAELPSRTKRTLDRASLSATVLLKESRSSLRDANTSRVLELKKFVFERLNTGGKQLNAQEIRNAVYSGSFNDEIISLTRNTVFARAWGIPPYSDEYNEDDYESPERKRNNLYRSMGDCQIVLRFFALRQASAIKGSMRSILDKCMERNLDISQHDLIKASHEFVERLTFVDALFDGTPFRLTPDSKPSESMFDSVMIAIDKLWRNREKIATAKDTIQEAYWSALDTPEKIEQFSGRANTAKDIKLRIDKMTNLIRTAISNA